MIDLSIYKTWVFDCDGVLLDSNQVKTEAFHEVAAPYGQEAADSLVSYHLEYGGVSRYTKFNHFFKTILAQKEYEERYDIAIKHFGEIIKKRMMECAETQGATKALESLPKQTIKMVVSGGDQEELRDIFAKRGLSNHFHNIFGSPDTKSDIFLRELANNGIRLPAVFVGDSRLDYETALKFKIDFIFMSGYTDWKEWESEIDRSKTVVIETLDEITQVINRR